MASDTRILSGREVACRVAPITAFNSFGLFCGSSPHTETRPPSGTRKSFEHFNCAGLAGAVRAQEPENFAFLHGKAYAAHRVHVLVALLEVFDQQNRIWHRLFGRPSRLHVIPGERMSRTSNVVPASYPAAMPSVSPAPSWTLQATRGAASGPRGTPPFGRLRFAAIFVVESRTVRE